MPVQLDYTPELHQKEILDFLVNTATHFDSSQPTENDYTFVESREAGKDQTSLFAILKETYNVLDRTIVVSNFDAIIPIEQPAILTVRMNLLIVDSLTDGELRAKIIAAFRAYDPSTGVDVDDYVMNELSQESGLNSDMFQVIPSFALDKNGNKIEHRNQVNALLALYNDIKGSGKISLTGGSKVVIGTGTSFKTEINVGSVLQTTQNIQLGIVESIVDNTELTLRRNVVMSEANLEYNIGVETKFFMAQETNLARYFRRKGFRAVRVRQEFLEAPYNPSNDPVHQIESTNEADLDNVIKQDSVGLECGDLEIKKIKIAEVLAYPEFKTELVWRMVKIGCVKTLVPWFHKSKIRWTIVTLYACVGHRQNLANYILHRIETCAEGSALASTVIGIWFGNLASALVAFKALFVACIENYVGEEINCIVPDLATLSEKGLWEDI